jgi:hypothetical protein
MISNIVRLFILLLLVNILFGYYITTDDNQRFYQLLKQRSAENDNEYVWFTRDIHNDMNNDEIKQDRLWKQQDLFHSKIFNNIFNRKYPFIENTMYETK